MYTGLSSCKVPYCKCTQVCLHLKCHIVNVRRSVFMQSAILYLYTGLSSCKVPYCKCTQVCLHAKYHIVPVHRSVFIQSAILYLYTGLSSCKVPAVLVRLFNDTSILSADFRKKYQLSNFMKVHPLGTELFRTDGRTDIITIYI